MCATSHRIHSAFSTNFEARIEFHGAKRYLVALKSCWTAMRMVTVHVKGRPRLFLAKVVRRMVFVKWKSEAFSTATISSLVHDVIARAKIEGIR